MDWNEILNAAGKILVNIPGCDVPQNDAKSPEEGIKKVEALELEISPQIEATIRQIIRSQKTRTSTEEMYFVTLRIRYAMPLILALGTKPTEKDGFCMPIPEQFGKESILEWLLIDVWNSTNRDAWHENFENEPRTGEQGVGL